MICKYARFSSIKLIHVKIIRKYRDTTLSVQSLVVNPTLYCSKQRFPRSEIIRGAGLNVAIRFMIV